MKSARATNLPSTPQLGIFRVTTSGTSVEQRRHIFNAIARRAYELFKARGAEHGRDLQDWFRAESQLLTSFPAIVVDTDEGLKVTAEVPGFTSKDVEVLAEPSRLIIRAKRQETFKREKGRSVLGGKMSDEIFHVLELPHEIDPDNMKADIENGVLEVTLAKVGLGKKIAVGVKAA